jgi:carbonic anhydrase/SulP family sulfate permease
MLVIGHTRCGAVSAAVKLRSSPLTAAEATGCQHLDAIVNEILRSVDGAAGPVADGPHSRERAAFVDAVARQNVLRVVKEIREQSRTLDDLVRARRIGIVGAMYDIVTGNIEFLTEDGLGETALQKMP